MQLADMAAWLFALGGCCGILLLLLVVAGLFMRSATLGDERPENYDNDLRDGRY